MRKLLALILCTLMLLPCLAACEKETEILYDDEKTLTAIDQQAAKRREAIRNTPNMEIPADAADVYYIIPDDEEPQYDKEIHFDDLNSQMMRTGTYVLFRRGEEYRGKFKGKQGVTYSAYGEGDKPIINASRADFADPAYWEETDVPNVYKATETFNNVGNMVFNYSGIIGNYDETVGQLKIVNKGGFTGYRDLANDLEFHSNLDTGELYLYSTEGNPGERFDSIEICEDDSIVWGNSTDVVIDNLTFIFGGGHGVGSNTTENRTVQNCIFAWIGGSILRGYGDGTVRYGNAVEVYGGCDGYYVYDNWIYQIYDTGITHQHSGTDKLIVMNDIEYRGNIVEYCHWSIEYYNGSSDPESRMTNIHVHDNIALYGCYGWGSVGRESEGALHNSFGIVANVSDYVVENNIFAYSKGNVVRYNPNDELITFRHNTYVQYQGRSLGYIFGKNEAFNENAVTVLTEVMGEEAPTIVFITDESLQ